MAFEKYTWKDRVVAFPGRRRVLNTEDELDVEIVDITRANDTVTQAGDRFNASTMNNLESRIEAAFNAVNQKISMQFDTVYPIGAIYQSFSNTNPATLFPGTTWTKLPDNKVLVPSETPGQSSGNSGNTVSMTPSGTSTLSGTIEGAYADLPSHNHKYKDSFPDSWKPDTPKGDGSKYKHDHGYVSGTVTSVTRNTNSTGGINNQQQKHTHGFGPIYSSFAGTPVNIDIRQPYTTIYAWRRTS